MPLLQQPGKDLPAIARKAVEPLVALFFLAPLAYEQALGFQAPQQRIERAFVDVQAALCERLAQRVSLILLVKLGKHRQGQAAAAKFQAKVFEEVFCDCHAVPHTLYINYCITHSVWCQVYLAALRSFNY